MGERTWCDHLCPCPNYCEPECDNATCYAYTHSAIKEVPKVTSPDPNSYIQASAQTLAETLASKNSDYAPAGEFSNFEKAAEIANVEPIDVMMAQIGIKVTRIQGLMSGIKQVTHHESLKDSLLDLAGYATIAHAYLEYAGENESDADCIHIWEKVGMHEYACAWCPAKASSEEFSDE